MIAEEWTESLKRAYGAGNQRRLPSVGDPGWASRLIAAAAGAVFAAIPALWVWGYMVDDALITARVAANIAAGAGHRFNNPGPISDAVTPLGYAYLLSGFARDGALAAYYSAKGIGLACWASAAGWLFQHAVFRLGPWWRVLPLLQLLCLPLAAWAVSGMETGIVTAFCTLAVAGPGWAAGLAAAWRPELLPWALVLVVGRALLQRRGALRVMLAFSMVSLPAIIVGVIRYSWFGRAYPLAVLAKPSDMTHGLAYLILALALTGPPFLLLAWGNYKKLAPRERMLGVAFVAHCVALVLAGGDWMSFYRLMVPVLPGVIVLGVHLAAVSSLRGAAVRSLLATAAAVVLWVMHGNSARHVQASRLQVMRSAVEPLRGAKVVAALDVGWVGTITNASIVDLAGLTDPQIAALPGGHTSKRIPAGLLEGRKVDALVLLVNGDPGVPLERSDFARVVDRRVAWLLKDEPFRLEAVIPLPRTAQKYLILRRKY